jgi:hypothetical protein
LFAALSLTMVVGLLITGAVATTRVMQRSWRVEHMDAELTMDADAGVATVLSDLHRLGLDDTPLGKAVTVAVPLANAPGTANVSITRLPFGVLWIVADVSRAGGDDGRRRVNLLAEFPLILWADVGAVVARGDVELGPDVSITLDTDTEPDCKDPRGVAVSVAPGANVSFADTAAVVTSADASDSAAYLLTAFQLAALQQTRRFVHVVGDTTIVGGAFDGILLVEGALTIAGPFAATGLIVARGPIVATGPVTIVGSIRSFSEPGIGKLAIKFSGASIRYSRCAVERALRRALDARPAVQRSWAEIF